MRWARRSRRSIRASTPTRRSTARSSASTAIPVSRTTSPRTRPTRTSGSGSGPTARPRPQATSSGWSPTPYGSAAAYTASPLTSSRACAQRWRTDSAVRRLERALDDLRREGYLIGDQTLKRVPAGYSAQHPRAELLRYTNVNAIAEVSPPPAELESAAFVDWCMERFTQAKPLVDWLAEEIGGD